MDASPFVGYRLTQKYSAGIGAKYIYRGFPEQNINLSYYGGNLFSRYQLTRNFLAHVEYELLNVYETRPISLNFGERTLASMFYIGGAYSTSIGGNATVQIMLLYDLINDYNDWKGSENYAIGMTRRQNMATSNPRFMVPVS